MPTNDVLPATEQASPESLLRIVDLVPRIAEADSPSLAVPLLRQAVRMLGADAGVFLSVVDDDALSASCRVLLACDQRWSTSFRDLDWRDECPWIRHALNSAEPIRGADLTLLPREETFVRQARELGFESTVIAPAPSNAGSSRIGVLCIGSRQPNFFDDGCSALHRTVLQALAMGLHGWVLRMTREGWLARSGLTPHELELLRHEAAGHSSKWIAAALNLNPTTIDTRFQRLIAKLDVPDRRTAARIAILYGLL